MSVFTPILDRPAAPQGRTAAQYAGLHTDVRRATAKQIRQLLVGIVALPLTALPFIAYANLTPEGRLVRDRAIVALSPPTLPDLSPRQVAAAVAAAPRYEGSVMALAYHGIGSASDAEGGFVLSAKRFGEHLATLKAAGMNTVTAAQVAAAFKGGKPLPPNAVMLSFDDGRADAMMFADPLLAQAGMSATMFVISGAAAKPGVYYASWDKIESYARSGRWDMQSHTSGSHREHKAAGGESLPKLTSLAGDESLEDFRARIREDLVEASEAIERHVGRRPVAFAYPFGAYGGDRTNDPRVADVVREEVARLYAVAFQQDDQETIPLLTGAHDLVRLRRLEVNDWSGTELLERIGQAKQFAAEEGRLEPAPAGTETGTPPVASGPETDAPGAVPSTTVTSTSPPATTPRGGRQPVAAVTVPTLPAIVPPNVNVPVPTVAVTVPPVTVTLPPVTVPPIVTTVPPITSPPTTRPPSTTVPPTTPPTTVCKSPGKSGKCQGSG